MRYSIPFTSGVVVVMGVPLVWRNLRRGCTKFLRLTPNGFEFEQRWHSQSGDWHQVRDVTEDVPGQQALTTAPPTLAAGAMTLDGSASRELVRFYWEHAESRRELTDGRALRRLAALDGAQ